MWLAEAGGLRILFDPLLDNHFFGDVFRVYPSRTLHVEALKPDFIVVSHRHPDHFDAQSLHRLAQLDPDTVLITSEPFIAETCKALGFRTTAVADAFYRVGLTGGVTMLTTPSHGGPGADPEWGIMVATEDGVAWNQVDTIHGAVADVEATLGAAQEALGQTRWPIALALARWLPMREVEPLIGEATHFPWEDYSALLEQVAAIGAHTVVPGAGGQRHAAPFDMMNQRVYPVGSERFVRDYHDRTRRHAAVAEIGAVWRIHDGMASRDGQSSLAEATETELPPDFRPTSGLPPLVDPGHPDVSEERLRRRCESWVRDDLANALRADLGTGDDMHLCCLRIVHATDEQCFTLAKTGNDVSVFEGYDAGYDVYNEVAGSMLYDVIEGRRHWGEPLLAGMLRASHRSYRARWNRPLQRTSVGIIFLYHALSYQESQERAVRSYLATIDGV